jgi:hypothetical protein
VAETQEQFGDTEEGYSLQMEADTRKLMKVYLTVETLHGVLNCRSSYSAIYELQEVKYSD